MKTPPLKECDQYDDVLKIWESYQTPLPDFFDFKVSDFAKKILYSIGFLLLAGGSVAATYFSFPDLVAAVHNQPLLHPDWDILAPIGCVCTMALSVIFTGFSLFMAREAKKRHSKACIQT
jgi:hypothetical protein